MKRFRALTAAVAITSLALIAVLANPSSSAPLRTLCGGHDRWEVKTLSDARATLVAGDAVRVT